MENKGVWRIGENNTEQVIISSHDNDTYRICSNKDSKSYVVVTYETYYTNETPKEAQNLHPGNCIDIFGFKITISSTEKHEQANGTYEKLKE